MSGQQTIALLPRLTLVEAGPILPGYSWGPDTSRYRNGETGRFVARKDILVLLSASTNANQESMRAGVLAYHSGELDQATFLARTTTMLRREYLQNTALGSGGWERMGPVEWGRIGGRLRSEYAYLRGFAQEIADGTVSAAQAAARMQSYVGGARHEFFRAERENKAPAEMGKIAIERRVLSPEAKHCRQCPEYAALGWRPAGELPLPTEECDCRNNCLCSIQTKDVAADAADEMVGTGGGRAVTEFDPDQPRDEGGKWSDVGGGGGPKDPMGRWVDTGKGRKDRGYGWQTDQTKGESRAVRDIDAMYLYGRVNEASEQLHYDQAAAQARAYMDKWEEPGPNQAFGGMTEVEKLRQVSYRGITWRYTEETEPAAAQSLAAMVTTREGDKTFEEWPKHILVTTDAVVFTGQANKEDEYWGQRYGIDHFRSAATGGEGTIVVYGGRQLDRESLAHEMGHNYARKLWGTGSPSESSDYRGAIASGEKPYTPYGTVSPVEDFAEHFSMYFAGETRRGDLEVYAHRRFAIIQRMVNDRRYTG